MQSFSKKVAKSKKNASYKLFYTFWALQLLGTGSFDNICLDWKKIGVDEMANWITLSVKAEKWGLLRFGHITQLGACRGLLRSGRKEIPDLILVEL